VSQALLPLLLPPLSLLLQLLLAMQQLIAGEA
jgi:hypothetical protein